MPNQPRVLAEKLIHIDAGEADFAALHDLFRQGVRVNNEQLDDDPHLYELVPKPWGYEYRVYADDLLDVWELNIEPSHSTSMHAHPRKTTYLLCLSGEGTVSSLTAQTPISAGDIVRISRGAFHSTRNTGSSTLVLVEVETPRNKFDLVRYKDSYQRAGQGYEKATTALTVTSRRVPYLPNARLCRTSPNGRFGYSIVSGFDVHYRRRDSGAFLVPISVRELALDHMDILTDGPADERRPQLDSYYLAIRHHS